MPAFLERLFCWEELGAKTAQSTVEMLFNFVQIGRGAVLSSRATGRFLRRADNTNMVIKVNSATLIGVDAARVQIETQIVKSLRRFAIVGLADGVLRESKERIRCAIENSGFSFPDQEVIVSLTPASLPKVGAGFELGIALSILAAAGHLPPHSVSEILVLGELSLDGRVRSVRTALAAACLLRGTQQNSILTAARSAGALSQIEGVKSIGVETLLETVMVLRGELEPRELKSAICKPSSVPQCNFSDVVGQLAAKRALEIAAAGGHNLLMVGPPGSGKSMLARRITSIMPPISESEALDVSRIYQANTSIFQSIHGEEPLLKKERPFRAPHHTTSTAGLIGGGSTPVPGEISLAHRGVLFLDEFPELRRDAVESLREPLEEKRIAISRSKFRVSFPADFLLIAAMNPCPCGRRGLYRSSSKTTNIKMSECECPPAVVKRYMSRLSGPLLDRIDLQIWVPPVPISELSQKQIFDSTNEMKERVRNARARQIGRCGGPQESVLNSALNGKAFKRACSLTRESEQLVERASEKYNLSARGYTRLLRVSRTIADLDDAESIQSAHVSEALMYRMLER